MNLNSGIFFLLALCSSCNLSFASTEQVLLHYSGTVVIPPCTIEVPKVPIDFGNIQAPSLSTSSDTTEWKDFSLDLSGCTDVTTVWMTFAGASSPQSGYFANSGTAKNLAIELEMVENKVSAVPLYPGATITPNISGQSTASFPFHVRIRNDGNGPATTGSVTTVITVNYVFK